jgi:Flp pilus assembly protein TadB
MNDNAGPLSSAANKDPAGPSAKPRRRRAVAVSPGNGVVKQVFDFIEDMSDGNLVQRCIAVFVAVILPVLLVAALVGIVAVSVYIVVMRPGSVPLVGGAAFLSGGTAWIVGRRRQRRAKATGDEPRN